MEELDHTFKPVRCSNGDELRVEVIGTEALVVTRSADGGVDEARVEFPKLGLGGGRLVLSPSERYVVLSRFSGQSEEGYDLLSLEGGLTRIGGLECVFGEYASYTFTGAEDRLVMALPYQCSEWWQPWVDGDVRDAGNECVEFDFGQLRFHEIATGEITVHELVVFAPRSWEPSRSDYPRDMDPRFVGEDRLSLCMPWGTEEVRMPAPASVRFRIPAEA